jgi:pilus assembly protein CpaF
VIPHASHDQNVLALLEPVAALLKDASVGEIMINGPHSVFVERDGRIERAEVSFERAQLLAALRGIAQFAGRNVSAERPILEARLPDGSRVEAVLPPAAPDGPFVSIRRVRPSALTLDALVMRGAVAELGATVLHALVAQRMNVLIAGGTGSGKTSVLSAMAALIPTEERIVVIEDARELSLPHPHVVQLEACPPDARGRGEVNVRQLFRATLRLRPDRVVVGEIRGAEALELIQAMTSGHGGCLSTIHASSALESLQRLETLALMSDVQLPLHALRAQIGCAVQAVVQTARLHDGRREIAEISSVAASASGYMVQPLYRSERPHGRGPR